MRQLRQARVMESWLALVWIARRTPFADLLGCMPKRVGGDEVKPLCQCTDGWGFPNGEHSWWCDRGQDQQSAGRGTGGPSHPETPGRSRVLLLHDSKIQSRTSPPAIIGGERRYCAVCGARAYQRRAGQDDELCERCFQIRKRTDSLLEFCHEFGRWAGLPEYAEAKR